MSGTEATAKPMGGAGVALAALIVGARVQAGVPKIGDESDRANRIERVACTAHALRLVDCKVFLSETGPHGCTRAAVGDKDRSLHSGSGE